MTLSATLSYEWHCPIYSLQQSRNEDWQAFFALKSCCFHMSVGQHIHQNGFWGIWDDEFLWLQLHHHWHCFSAGLGCNAVFVLCLDWCENQHFGTIRNCPVDICTILLPQFLVHFVVLHFVGEPIFSQCRYLAEPFFSLQICQVLGVYFVKDWWEWQVDVNAFWVMRSRTLLSKLHSVSECKSISIPTGPCGIDRLWVDTHSSYYSLPLNSSHDSVPCKCSCIFSVLVTPLIEWSIYL